jgi:hypothetical protein
VFPLQLGGPAHSVPYETGRMGNLRPAALAPQLSAVLSKFLLLCVDRTLSTFLRWLRELLPVALAQRRDTMQ